MVYRVKYTRNTLVFYVVFSLPALGIEYWFETIGRPKYAENGELKKSGEDLEAKGLTEFMWDVLYWTWACIAAAALLGNGAWYMYAAVPAYAMWMASTVLLGMRNNMAGKRNQDTASGEVVDGGESKRQKKLEKRGQKTQYR